ncbi:hypothetical protein [Agrobacterium vitis]|uniref:hypothetical protein n=1 Tax=Agrobacterium vitis TaxID=373 RepID=UPI0005A1E180|nr:hypothetical protein [Agrobacterium vitis]MVA62353.1 hypothetical protein [Agrobacterium vitis]
MRADGALQFGDIAINASIQINDWKFHGDKFDPVAFRDADSNRHTGIFDNLFFHSHIPARFDTQANSRSIVVSCFKNASHSTANERHHHNASHAKRA